MKQRSEKKMKSACQGWKPRGTWGFEWSDDGRVNWFRGEREMMIDSALDFFLSFKNIFWIEFEASARNHVEMSCRHKEKKGFWFRKDGRPGATKYWEGNGNCWNRWALRWSNVKREESRSKCWALRDAENASCILS